MPIGTSFATTVELLPERIDFASSVLQGAGLGAILGMMLAALRRTDPERGARIGTLMGATLGLALFVLGLAIAWVS